jgi:hypothetical protein
MIKCPMARCGLLVAAFALLSVAPATAAESCESWMASIKDYDAAFERVMQGEPEGLLQFVMEARDPDRKAAAKKAAAEKLAGLKGIDPPPELSAVHGQLVAYAQTIVQAAAAAKPTDTDLSVPALRKCYRALLDYYLSVRDLMRIHNCQGGDLEALEQRIIPQLEGLLNNQEEKGAIAP